jgi:diadenosine tetraphosphate (Ap4A) HIT family hydrolase
MAVPTCPFCTIVARGTSDDGRTLLFSDERVVVFNDRSPASKVHLLVCPRVHLDDVNSLDRTHVELVRHMRDTGTAMLHQLGESDEEAHVLGFHVPPWTSVHHLHLHCIALPWTPSWRSVKYPSQLFCGLRMPWFVPVSDLLTQLGNED